MMYKNIDDDLIIKIIISFFCKINKTDTINKTKLLEFTKQIQNSLNIKETNLYNIVDSHENSVILTFFKDIKELLDIHPNYNPFSIIYEVNQNIDIKIKNGQFFTNKILSNYMIDEVNNINNVNEYKYLDPSCGSGILLKEVLEKILETKKDYNESNIYGYDIDVNLVIITKLNLFESIFRIKFNNDFNNIDKIIDFNNIKLVNDTIKDFLDVDNQYIKVLDKYIDGNIKDYELDFLKINVDNHKNNIDRIKYLDLMDNIISKIKGLNFLNKTKYLIKDKKTFNLFIKTNIYTKNKSIQVAKYISENLALFDFKYKKYMNVPLFDLERLEFDLIISNPPYLNSKNYHNSLNLNDILKDYSVGRNSNGGGYNLYLYFYLLNEKMLKKNGIFIFLTPSDILYKVKSQNVLNYLYNKFTISKIIDFGNQNIFETLDNREKNKVGTYSSIIVGKNIKEERHKTNFIIKDNNSSDYIEKDINIYDYFIESGKEYNIQNYITDFLDDGIVSVYPKLNKGVNKINNIGNKGNLILNGEGYKYLSNCKNLLYKPYKFKYSYELFDLGVSNPFRKGEELIGKLRNNKNKQFNIIDKKFKITWDSGSYNENIKKFMISFDNDFIGDISSKCSIGTNNDKNIKRLLFLFGYLNTNYVKEHLKEKYNGIYGLKNIMNIPIDEKLVKDKYRKILSLSKNIIKQLKDGKLDDDKNIIQMFNKINKIILKYNYKKNVSKNNNSL